VEHHGETEVLGLIQVDFSYCDAPWLGAPRAVLLIMSREFPLGSLLPTDSTRCYLVTKQSSSNRRQGRRSPAVTTT
jgi:hypothetical protein